MKRDVHIRTGISILIAGLAAPLLGAACAHRPQAVRWEVPLQIETEVVRTGVVPSGRVEGVVVDGRDGQPLGGVQLVFEGSSAGTLSDSLGRFAIDAPSSGRQRLRLKHLGFAEQDIRIDAGAPTGYAARIGMRPAPIDVCGHPIDPFPAVMVYVRDARTGRAPLTPVRLEVRLGVEHVRVHGDARGDAEGVRLEVEELLPDRYTIEVSAAGYRTWERRGVEVRQEDCRTPRAFFAVWLLPGG